MSTTPALAFLASACLAVAALQTPPADVTARVQALEQQLAAQSKQVEALTKDLTDTKALLEKTVRYVNEQSHAAAALAGTLDESEQAGFTYGINPESRHILLRGWREALTAAQRDVPPAPPAPAPAKAGNGRGQ
jgi:uncharacterized coiled-coil protein SlyX